MYSKNFPSFQNFLLWNTTWSLLHPTIITIWPMVNYLWANICMTRANTKTHLLRNFLALIHFKNQSQVSWQNFHDILKTKFSHLSFMSCQNASSQTFSWIITILSNILTFPWLERVKVIFIFCLIFRMTGSPTE